MRLKNALLRCNKKSGKSVCFDSKRKSGGNPPQIQPSPKQNRSESQCSRIIQELMNRGKYAYVGSWVKCALVKSSGVSKITLVRSKKQRITVSVFLSTLQLTALLLGKIRLRLHCYTLNYYVSSWPLPSSLYRNFSGRDLNFHQIISCLQQARLTREPMTELTKCVCT